MQKRTKFGLASLLVLIASVAYAAAGDKFIENQASDGDLIFKVNDGGTPTEAFRLKGSTSSVVIPTNPGGASGTAVVQFSGTNNAIISALEGLTFNIDSDASSSDRVFKFSSEAPDGTGRTLFSVAEETGETIIGNSTTASTSARVHQVRNGDLSASNGTNTLAVLTGNTGANSAILKIANSSTTATADVFQITVGSGVTSFRNGTPALLSQVDNTSGNWSIGGTSVASTAPGFYSNAAVMLSINSAGTTNNAGLTMTENSGSSIRWHVYTNSSDQIRVSDNGDNNGTTMAQNADAWSGISDERWKEDWTELTGALAKIDTLRAGTFYRKDVPGVRKVGLIAQDVLQVQPEAVDLTNPDRLELRYTEVLPLAIKAIQELKRENQALRARLDSAGL